MIITTDNAPAIWPNKEYLYKKNVVFGFTIIGLGFYSQRAKTIINYPDQVEFGVVLCRNGVVNKYCEIRADIYFYARSYKSLKQ